MKKPYFTLMKAGLGIAIIAVLSYTIGLREILGIISSTNPVVYLIIAIGYLLNALLNTASYSLVLSKLNVKIRFKTLFRHFVSSWSIGTIIPGKFGDLSIIYFLKKQNIEVKDSAIMYLVDKAGTFAFYVMMATITFYLLLPGGKIYIPMMIAIIALLSFVLFLRFGTKIISKLLKKYAMSFEEFAEKLKAFMRKDYSLFIILILLSAIRWAVLALSMWLVLGMAGVYVDFPYVYLISVTINILALIPITISGLGLKEGASVYMYGLIGVPAGLVMAASLIYSIATIGLALIGLLMIQRMEDKK